MTFGLRLNWHYNPVADVSNPLVRMPKNNLPDIAGCLTIHG